MAEVKRLVILGVDRYRAMLRVHILGGHWDFAPDYQPALTQLNRDQYVLVLTYDKPMKAEIVRK